jgi:kinesin family member 5
MLQLTYENEKLRRDIRVAQDIAAQAQHTAAAGRASSLLDFVPAALLRPFGFVPD